MTAERELTRALGASCNTPVGAHARLHDNERLELMEWVGKPDGSAWLSDQVAGPVNSTVGTALAERMLSAGAAELLGDLRA